MCAVCTILKRSTTAALHDAHDTLKNIQRVQHRTFVIQMRRYGRCANLKVVVLPRARCSSSSTASHHGISPQSPSPPLATGPTDDDDDDRPSDVRATQCPKRNKCKIVVRSRSVRMRCTHAARTEYDGHDDVDYSVDGLLLCGVWDFKFMRSSLWTITIRP